MNKKISCDPLVYNPAKKTCNNIYCHSNGNDDYKEICWYPTKKLECNNGCHGAPPKTEHHKGASLKTCGQRCHRETIKNGYTTNFHINGKVDGIYEEDETNYERDCIKCHCEPQGEHPAIGLAVEMPSNHVGGQPMNHDCKVCHMEEFNAFHENKVVELKNHKNDKQYYTLESSKQLDYIYQFNQFCKGCHFTGDSTFIPNPFRADKQTPFIDNETLRKEALPDELEIVRFWYPHNHIVEDVEDVFNEEQIIHNVPDDPMLNDKTGTPMYNGFNTQQIMNNSGPNSMFYDAMKAYMNKGIDGSGGGKQRRRMGIPVGGIGGGMPVIGPITGSPLDPVLGSNPSAIIAIQTTPVAPLPLMGGGIVPSLGAPGAISLIAPPALPGGDMLSQPAPGVLVPSPVIAPGTGISMFPGIEAMNLIRSGPGPMIMGPGIPPLVEPLPMMMIPLTTTGSSPMPSPMIMDSMMRNGGPMIMTPMMMDSMMRNGGPMIMTPMMMDPMMRNGGPMIMTPMMMDPMMRNGGPMIMTPMMMDPMMRNGGPMIMTPMMMDPMTRNGGPMIMTPMMMDPMTRNVPMPPMTQYRPTSMSPPNNKEKGQPSCLACHTHEDASMLENSLIIKCYHGHFSHQNCIYCHVPHGSQFPGLLRDGINWNRQNRSCNVDTCHPTHKHIPPLGTSNIYYELRLDASCNVNSCHVGSTHKDGMAGK